VRYIRKEYGDYFGIAVAGIKKPFFLSNFLLSP
jgi:hypothetical protein